MSDPTHSISIERVDSLSEQDLSDLCDAAESAILEGGGFGWLKPPPRSTMERFWHGALLVPERSLFIGRLDSTIAGSAQLVRPARNNEAQQHIATITTNFVAPYARGYGLARGLTKAVETAAAGEGFQFLQLDVRATQDAAIQLYESRGYTRWAVRPHYAVVEGAAVEGYYYEKDLRPPSGKGKGKRTPS